MESNFFRVWLKIVQSILFLTCQSSLKANARWEWKSKHTLELFILHSLYCGVMKPRQTCPLVSRVGTTEQTQHRADVTPGKADQGWPLYSCADANCPVEVRLLPLQLHFSCVIFNSPVNQHSCYGYRVFLFYDAPEKKDLSPFIEKTTNFSKKQKPPGLRGFCFLKSFLQSIILTVDVG